MIFQDGELYLDINGNCRVPTVFDNLIHQEKIPVTIAIFINHGRFPEEDDPYKKYLPTQQRSVEYDMIDDQYANFLLEEIVPTIKAKYNLTKDPNGWSLCGGSSGGICAFTAAWHHPDKFRKVIIHMGSFVNIHGGHNYPLMIRQHKTKPVKVYYPQVKMIWN